MKNLPRVSIPFLAWTFSTVLSACSGADSTTLDDNNLTARPGDLGGTCGGFAGIRCKQGLQCSISGAGSHPDAAGKCMQGAPALGSEGATCGGIAGLRCQADLVCSIPKHDPPIADAAGKCQKAEAAKPNPGTLGAECAGFAGLRCQEGLSCVVPKSDPPIADAGGTCQKLDAPLGKEGAACGTRGMAPCASELFCAFSITASCGANDASGVCTARPEVCVADFQPVCGCDGREFNNPCVAAHAGVSARSIGPCAAAGQGAGQTCGGIAGLRCAAGLTCRGIDPKIADGTGKCG